VLLVDANVTHTASLARCLHPVFVSRMSSVANNSNIPSLVF